jgi:hypothetical protein
MQGGVAVRRYEPLQSLSAKDFLRELFSFAPLGFTPPKQRLCKRSIRVESQKQSVHYKNWRLDRSKLPIQFCLSELLPAKWLIAPNSGEPYATGQSSQVQLSLRLRGAN